MQIVYPFWASDNPLCVFPKCISNAVYESVYHIECSYTACVYIHCCVHVHLCVFNICITNAVYMYVRNAHIWLVSALSALHTST